MDEKRWNAGMVEFADHQMSLNGVEGGAKVYEEDPGESRCWKRV